MINKTGINFAHDQAVGLAEATRQTAVAAAGNNQRSVIAAEVAFYRAVAASCRTNNNGSGLAEVNVALAQLGFPGG
jgi:hypothetical protein